MLILFFNLNLSCNLMRSCFVTVIKFDRPLIQLLQNQNLGLTLTKLQLVQLQCLLLVLQLMSRTRNNLFICNFLLHIFQEKFNKIACLWLDDYQPVTSIHGGTNRSGILLSLIDFDLIRKPQILAKLFGSSLKAMSPSGQTTVTQPATNSHVFLLCFLPGGNSSFTAQIQDWAARHKDPKHLLHLDRGQVCVPLQLPRSGVLQVHLC